MLDHLAKQSFRLYIFLLLYLSVQTSCTKNPAQVPKLSPDKRIKSFSIRMYNNLGLVADAAATITNDTIRFALSEGYPLFYLFPTIDFTGKFISPAVTVAQNFSSPVIYAVTAEDGTTKNYIVLGKSVLSNSSKDILSFVFKAASNPSISNDVKGTIAGDSIIVKMPPGTVLNRLTPVILINGASISPDNLQVQDFSHPVAYKVSAQDGSLKTYPVTVSN